MLRSVQEDTEGTLTTPVEAGASGYSVTGGGQQGIFVAQVLKDSSAAKLFSLREGTSTAPPWAPHGLPEDGGPRRKMGRTWCSGRPCREGLATSRPGPRPCGAGWSPAHEGLCGGGAGLLLWGLPRLAP